MITAVRTGRCFEGASEFLVTYPDGYQCRMWSPSGVGWTPEEEERQAVAEATKLYAAECHRLVGETD